MVNKLFCILLQINDQLLVAPEREKNLLEFKTRQTRINILN